MKSFLRPRKKSESLIKYIMSVSHLWLGLLSSVIVMVVCISGCLYAFKNQIEDFYNRRVLFVSDVITESYSIDSIVRNFEADFGKAARIVIPEKGSDR